jgi:hypothetical protein
MLLRCPHPMLLCRPPSHARGVQLGSGHGGGATTSVAAVPREIRVPASSLARRSGRRSTGRSRALILPATSRIRGGSPAPATTTPTSSRLSSKCADVAAAGRSRARRSRHLRRLKLVIPLRIHGRFIDVLKCASGCGDREFGARGSSARHQGQGRSSPWRRAVGRGGATGGRPPSTRAPVTPPLRPGGPGGVRMRMRWAGSGGARWCSVWGTAGAEELLPAANGGRSSSHFFLQPATPRRTSRVAASDLPLSGRRALLPDAPLVPLRRTSPSSRRRSGKMSKGARPLG